MAIPIWNKITGNVFIRNFDEGIFRTMGAVPDPTNINDPCYSLTINAVGGGTIKIPVFFSQPEPIFQKMIYPFITVTRDDIALAMHRYMGVGQLEYKVGVSGTPLVSGGVSGYGQYAFKFQAFPHDITYTIQCWDRYESPSQNILLNVLNAFYPLGKLVVYDSLLLRRTYEYYWEGSIANLQEIIDPVTRARGYALTIRVEGELDIANLPTANETVSAFDVGLTRF